MLQTLQTLIGGNGYGPSTSEVTSSTADKAVTKVYYNNPRALNGTCPRNMYSFVPPTSGHHEAASSTVPSEGEARAYLRTRLSQVSFLMECKKGNGFNMKYHVAHRVCKELVNKWKNERDQVSESG